MKALERVLILDFSKLLPGPLCSMLLADLGCRVIRVEIPYWKDFVREVPPLIDGHGFCYWMVNRNKESLALDFRKPAGRKALLRLLAKADVVLEGFRPGLMTRLGLGPRELCRRFPRLVYCSITGYGQKGPLSRKAGHDLNFLAQSGYLALGDSAGALAFPPVQIADVSGSMYAASAVLAALLERGRTGRGQHIDVSCAESVMSWQVLAMGQYFATGRVPAPRSEWWNGSHPFYRLYRTRDGRHLAVGALERGFALNLLTAVGRPDLAGLVGTRLERMPARLHRELEAVFAGKSVRQWEKKLAGKDVCVTPVLNLKEALRHPFVAGRGALVRVPGGGFARTLTSPMRLSRSRFRVRRAPPGLGRDNATVLRLLGYSSREMRSLRSDGVIP